MTKKQKKNLIRILVAAGMLAALHFVHVEGFLLFVLYLIPYAVVGYDILWKAAKGIVNGQVFDENFLMAVATLGAMAIGLLETNDYVEVVAVMLFYQIGELFQSIAIGKSRKNISELMDIRPDYANLETDGKTERVDPDEVAVGSVIVVRPGEKIPIDGTVIEGTSTLDTAALTGESVPRTAKEGDAVTSGCINMTGVLRIETTKEFGESTASKILDLVENASSRKSQSENFITKFARYYTPAVCYGALALAVIPPLVRMLVLGLPAGWNDWIYRALTFLVISCPCALVISIPLSFFAGIGGASNAGVLVKGSNCLEALSKTKTVVFDKTGTLTRGVFEVVAVHHNEMPEELLLKYAAYAESASSHPIARSIRNAYRKDLEAMIKEGTEDPEPFTVRNIEETGGNGVTAFVSGRFVACGNGKLMDRLRVPYIECHDTGTIVHVAIDSRYEGHIVISDVLKPTAKDAIAALKGAGIARTVMLTGDRKAVADETAKELGIDDVRSEL
ncbi:MAG: heavy metal translocating P-type ATPase, partial [Firmicutes bacterium]|nr:heavy metal translocating P-type ATPase [Bacillota bacterium]